MENKRVSYTPAQKRAIMNYRARNVDKIRNANKAYYEKLKLDPNFIVNKNEKAKLYYYNKKLMKQNPLM